MGEFIPNRAAIQSTLNGPDGPVYRAARRYAEEVVQDVKNHGPLGFAQHWSSGYIRITGLLRADMSIRAARRDLEGVTFVVGTDPVNPRDGYHYAYRVHQGHDGFASTQGIMRFQTRDHEWHNRFEVGPADPVPFLYDAIRRVNAAHPDLQLTLEPEA